MKTAKIKGMRDFRCVVLSHPTPSGHSPMAISLREAVAAQLLSSGPSSRPELAECWNTAAASLQGQ